MSVMGTREMNPEQLARADALRTDFEMPHRKLFPNGTVTLGDESARLYAVARTHLEIACAMAVKAVSRDNS